MKRFFSFFFISGLFVLLFCGKCHRTEWKDQVSRHHEALAHARATKDSLALRHEQLYVTDSLHTDSLFASPRKQDYLHAWTDSYAPSGTKSAEELAAATEHISADVKRLAVRLLDAGETTRLEEILRTVSSRLLERGMNNAAAVAAAAAVGFDADPALPGDIAQRLLTRLLLVGKQAPPLSHAAPSTPEGSTLLVFYETGCTNCELILRELTTIYTTLREKGVRVISISSDDTEAVFAARAASLPWETKWYDARGFYSPDFETYGIAVTPTLVVVKQDGTVAGTYHTLEETGLIRGIP